MNNNVSTKFNFFQNNEKRLHFTLPQCPHNQNPGFIILNTTRQNKLIFTAFQSYLCNSYRSHTPYNLLLK